MHPIIYALAGQSVPNLIILARSCGLVSFYLVSKCFFAQPIAFFCSLRAFLPYQLKRIIHDMRIMASYSP
jgi:hypothetical protein